jgi:hypothetical protein
MADSTDNTTLTAKQYNAIGALLAEPTVRSAAAVAGISERTMYNWLKLPAFAAEYRLARREATTQAIARLQSVSGQAATELLRLGLNARSEAVRLGAVSKVLELAIKSVELEDLAQRLDELERKYAQRH